MNARILITAITVLLSVTTASAQKQLPADSLTRELQEIVVTARQPATTLVGSTLVSTITGSSLQNIGNALDVLAQLPLIKVQDSDICVTGKDNIEIYIDGRPMRDSEELRNMLSSDLKKVELLMAPGAMYGSNTGAVLKITTRKKFMQGLSVTDQFQLQRRRRWSTTDFLGLNYRAGNWDIFIDGSFNLNNSVINGTTTSQLIYDGKQTMVGSSRHNLYKTDAGVLKGGFNYSNYKQAFGAYYRYNPECGNFSNNGNEWLDDELPLNRIITRRTNSHTHLVSAYYENRLAEKYLLHFDGDYRYSLVDNSVETTYTDTSIAGVNSADKRKSTLWAGKLYMNVPVGKGELTIGTQDSYTNTTLDYRMLSSEVGAYIPSSLTDVRQTSVALFASWTRMFGKFNMSAGARYEYVDYDFRVDGKRNDDVSRRDHFLTPDLNLGYSFNDHSQVTLSYKVSTVKPPYSHLTGALNYVGRHEIEGGNTGLRDEKMHNVQLFGMWKELIMQAGFTRSVDAYAFVKQVYPAKDLQLLLHPVNIDVSSLSLYMVWGKTIHCWTPGITFGIYKQWLEIDGDKYHKPIYSYYFDNAFSLPHGWVITANMSGQGSGYMHTNKFGTTWFTMDASVGKSFLNKSLTVKIMATDIFNTANNDWTMNTFGVFVDKRQKYDRRGVSLNITYRFQPRQNKYKGKAASEAEMNRL